MGTRNRCDVARQAANVVGALFQVAVPVLTGPAIGQISEENRTLIVPAGYAFAIWTPIFLLCFAYAAYQALPANRENRLLRRIGLFTAGAFFFDGLWELIFPARQFLLAQAVIVGIFVCAGVAYLRAQRAGGADEATSASSRAERWLVALPIGLLFGWITAATLVSFTTFVGIGLPGGGPGEAVLGAALLLFGGLVASAAILAGKAGPPQGYLAYAAAVLWALVGVVVNQYGVSVVTTGTATIAAVLVALTLFGALRAGRPRRGTDRTVQSDVAS